MSAVPWPVTGRHVLWLLGWMTCGVNAAVAIFLGEELRACAIALTGILLVLASFRPVDPFGRSGS